MASAGTRAGQKAGQRIADHCIVSRGWLVDVPSGCSKKRRAGPVGNPQARSSSGNGPEPCAPCRGEGASSFAVRSEHLRSHGCEALEFWRWRTIDQGPNKWMQLTSARPGWSARS